jgi:uncharacterized protein (TIGR02001 family)
MRARRKVLVIATALFLPALGASSAQAQDCCGRLYASLFLASDYRYDGLSLSGHEATAQASLYWWRPDKFYGGVWVSGVDFSDLGDTTTYYEIDVYGGRNFDFGRIQLTLEGMYSFFPDEDIPGPTYNFATAKGRLRRSVDALTFGSAIAWVPEAPYGGGPSWRLTGEVSYAWANWLTTNGQLGHRWNEQGADRAFWDIGATTMWKKISVDLRYSDTNLGFAECGFINWCEAGVAATLRLDLWK